MAWSDAARRAALEARRLHAKVRGMSMYNATVSATARGNMAHTIRAIRRAEMPSAPGVFRDAAGSTFLRNMRRRKRGYW